PSRSAQRTKPDAPPVPLSLAQPVSGVRYETESLLPMNARMMTPSAIPASKIHRGRAGLLRCESLSVDRAPAQADRQLGFRNACRKPTVPDSFVNPSQLAKARCQLRLFAQLHLVLAIGPSAVVAKQTLLFQSRDERQECQPDRLGVHSVAKRLHCLLEQV